MVLWRKGRFMVIVKVRTRYSTCMVSSLNDLVFRNVVVVVREREGGERVFV
jgi:hypothetical protein